MNLTAISPKNSKRLVLLGIITAIFGGSIFSPGYAQSAARKITLGNTVEPNPLVVRGKSGGKLKAVEVVNIESTATGFCNGFIGQKPNHILVLGSFFEFLKLEVSSSSDTTIIVEGPGGVWCNDDATSANPAIEGEWQPGQYRIWVGSYQESAKDEYQLSISK